MKRWSAVPLRWSRHLCMSMMAACYTCFTVFAATFLVRVASDHHHESTLMLLWICVIAAAVALAFHGLAKAVESMGVHERRTPQTTNPAKAGSARNSS